jgi:hypothetical protein
VVAGNGPTQAREKCSTWNISSSCYRAYNYVRTAKAKKAKRKEARPRPEKVYRLHASAEDELLLLADGQTSAESRWDRPRKRRMSLRVDVEVCRLVPVQRPGLAHADQPDSADRDDGGQETGGEEVAISEGADRREYSAQINVQRTDTNLGHRTVVSSHKPPPKRSLSGAP